MREIQVCSDEGTRENDDDMVNIRCRLEIFSRTTSLNSTERRKSSLGKGDSKFFRGEMIQEIHFSKMFYFLPFN